MDGALPENLFGGPGRFRVAAFLLGTMGALSQARYAAALVDFSNEPDEQNVV